MRTVTYKSVLDKANVLFTGKVEATRDDTSAFNRLINARHREFYEAFWWPDLMRVERRTFRPAYNGATVYAASTPSAPVEVYYWPTQGYYQALRAAPLTITSLTRVGTLATATVGAGHNLVTGTTPIITVSGVTPTGYNGSWTATITNSTQFTYSMPADPGGSGSGSMRAGINPANAGGQVISEYWAASASRYATNNWAAGTAYTVGVQVYQPLDGYYYQCITAHTNQQPPNATYWGVLTAFKRDIDYEPSATSNQGATATAIGEVRNIWNAHPWEVEDAFPVAFDLTSDGLIVRGNDPVVWVEFRLRPPDFTGTAWVATGSYAVGAQVYYSTTGEYYICISAATTEAPSDTSKWTKLDFATFLKEPVAQAALADIRKSTGQTSKWIEEMKETRRLLTTEFMKIERLQGQTRSLNVMTR